MLIKPIYKILKIVGVSYVCLKTPLRVTTLPSISVFSILGKWTMAEWGRMVPGWKLNIVEHLDS